jgi:hypothetical protein
MKKSGFSVILFLCLVLASGSLALGGPAPKIPATETKPLVLAERILLIDDFESGSLKSPRDWWTFDIEKAAAVPNKDLKEGDEQIVSQVGNYSMLLTGTARNWYVGGVGTYIAKEAQDLSKYSFLSLDVYGNGPGSGTLKIELYDDDNANWQVEQDPARGFAAVNDDKFVYELKVDWSGWKRVPIPIADFVDENQGVGDDIWNPQQTGGSGGLLQVQFICLGSTDKGMVNFNVDNVMLTVGTR